jgi:hypothetical protein
MAVVQFQWGGDRLEAVACVARLRSGESAMLSVTDECRGWDGDMAQCGKLYPVPYEEIYPAPYKQCGGNGRRVKEVAN